MIQANWLEVVNSLIASACLSVAAITCWFWSSDYRAKSKKSNVVPVRKFMIGCVALVTKIILFVALLVWTNSLWGLIYSPPPPFTNQSFANLVTNVTVTSIMTGVLVLGLYWRQCLSEGTYPGAPTERRIGDGVLPLETEPTEVVSLLTSAARDVSAAATQVAKVAAAEAAAIVVRNGEHDES